MVAVSESIDRSWERDEVSAYRTSKYCPGWARCCDSCPGGLLTRKSKGGSAYLGLSCRPIWATPLITSRPSKL